MFYLYIFSMFYLYIFSMFYLYIFSMFYLYIFSKLCLQFFQIMFKSVDISGFVANISSHTQLYLELPMV